MLINKTKYLKGCAKICLLSIILNVTKTQFLFFFFKKKQEKLISLDILNNTFNIRINLA